MRYAYTVTTPPVDSQIPANTASGAECESISPLEAETADSMLSPSGRQFFRTRATARQTLDGMDQLTELQRKTLAEAVAARVLSHVRGTKLVRIARSLALCVCLMVVVPVLCDILANFTAARILSDILEIVVFGSSVIVLPLLAIDQIRVHELRDDVTLLGRLGHPEAIFAVAASLKYRSLRSEAAESLVRLASEVTPVTAPTLPDETVAALCSALVVDDVPQMPILEALKVIGDGRAITAVNWLRYEGRNPRIRAAAAELIPILKRRSEDARTAQTLLRASSETQVLENLLLRAPASDVHSAPEELLRPSLQ